MMSYEHGSFALQAIKYWLFDLVFEYLSTNNIIEMI